MWAAHESPDTAPPEPGVSSKTVKKSDPCDEQPCPLEAGCRLTASRPFYECICHDLQPADPTHECKRPKTTPTFSNDTDTNNSTTPGPIHLFPGQIGPRHEGSTHVPRLLTAPSAVLSEQALMAMAMASGVVLVAILVLLVWKRRTVSHFVSRRSRRRARRSSGGHVMPPSKGSLQKCIQQYVTNPNYHGGDSLDKLLGEIEIPNDHVTFMNEIGEGCFGKVYKGEYNRPGASTSSAMSQATPLPVAIKVLKSGLSPEAEADFEKEIEILSSFNHPNIVRLLGVIRQGEDRPLPAMIFEFMELGDLAELLRSKVTRADKCEGQLTREQLTYIGAQIAAGMVYLSGQHFVHRDLATRNCLVGQGFRVKISDFGMSRDIYTCDYYKVSGSKMLPVRWMPPEAILYGKFTLESDVWSFGVVLWEIFTYARQPYYGHSNEEVVKLILQGILLIPPENCPQFVYHLMAASWKTEPKDRISFPMTLDTFLDHVTSEERCHLERTDPRVPVEGTGSGPKCSPDADDNGDYLIPNNVTVDTEITL
ncbi:Tyrosine-protein kinase transmembrane receptor Ror [Halotydeus destructor]|nr:Tyrosine-protein kinase transmembrane receptor Ror [Halotydeus destructor]